MKRRKRHLSAEFKARVPSEALKGIRSVNDIAQEYEVAPSQVSQWKKSLETRMVELFEGSNTTQKELKKWSSGKLRWSVKLSNSYLRRIFCWKSAKSYDRHSAQTLN